MKPELNQKYTTIALYTFVTATAILLVAALIFNFPIVSEAISSFAEVLTPVFLGLILAYLMNPIMCFIESKILRFKSQKRAGLRRGLAILLTVIFVLLVLSLILLLIVPQVYVSFMDLTNKVSGYVDHTVAILSETVVRLSGLLGDNSDEIAKYFTDILDFEKLAGYLEGIVTGIPKLISENVPKLVDYFSSLADGVLNTLLGIFFSIYFLASKEKLIAQLKKLFRSFVSEKVYDGTLRLCSYTDKTFGVYITGKMLDSLIVGVLCGIVCTICRIPYALLISVIVGICNMIPLAGPIIGAVPSAFIVFIVDPIKALWFIVIIVVIMQLDGNIIEPKVLGEATGLAAVWVLFSVTVMGGIFGLVGMVIAVPIFAVGYSVVKALVESRLEKKKLSTETSAYMKKS